MTDETSPARAGAGDDGIPATTADAKRWRRWPSATAQEIVRRTAAGESLRGIGADPDMPSFRVISGWIAKRPAFRAAILEARAEAAHRLGGEPPSYCRATAEIIFQRLCAGEGLVRMCREDPGLPSPSTIYRWMAKVDEFREAVAFAREIAAEGYFERGWELAEGATPETAYLTDVRLKHLRWHAGKLSPRTYGPAKPVDPPPPHDEDDRNNLTVVIKRYTWEGEPIEGAPEEVLYTMKQLPQTPQAKREAAHERAQRRLEEQQRFQREKEQALAEAIREGEARRRGEAAAGPTEGAAARPEKPWDPEGWT